MILLRIAFQKASSFPQKMALLDILYSVLNLLIDNFDVRNLLN